MFAFTLLAAVRKRLVLEARPSCRDNLTRLRSASLLDGRSYCRGASSCIRGLKKAASSRRTP